MPLTVAMDRAVPDACQGADFLLTYEAIAVAAGLTPTTSTTTTVLAATTTTVAPGGGRLPSTGADVAVPLAVAAALIAGGGVLRRWLPRR